ncbi:quinone-dependent dihydroorotate dehydrogenase [Oceanibacterium hippocampi]|uniref:Dihydroorotate dehydrogenase (quinone) n=1 Tax=Oceanibacterium hippocampi TaxID=745714 RepID=A0A1Y5RAM8_9PROT|nr:quinone-dependent dihydroorotate dehydrogenase [Oceanibacterium hippocampi]SLN11861.1 Dihydroorotate dehydrogenase (quinone) [Oceanibacterium hippocampi]
MNGLYRFLRPLVFALPPETAHALTLRTVPLVAALSRRPASRPALAQRLWDLEFPNPIGLAAGFDKNAEVPDAMLGLGFGFVEAGSVTPLPQAGNPRPRLFRLVRDRAVVNRMGFNNDGLDGVEARLRARRGRGGIVGANLGANKISADRTGDYVTGLARLAPFADFLVVNISSPNTPGLRALQDRAALEDLLGRLAEARSGLAGAAARVPVLLKIAPDLTVADREDIAAVALATGLDGLIVSNTTIARPDSLVDPAASESGGLSGRPLFETSTALLGEIYRLTEGRIPLIGVGGVASGSDAYAKIRAGASLVELYSALVYEGPGLVRRIGDELLAALHADGFNSIGEAVGADHR